MMSMDLAPPPEPEPEQEPRPEGEPKSGPARTWPIELAIVVVGLTELVLIAALVIWALR
jgi:hypothetical protein